MVHRSLVGSLERLFAHLIEVHGGAFPVWYSPVQISAVPVGPEQQPAAEEFARAAIDAGLRAEVESSGSVGARIRSAAGRKIPYVAVIGPREAPDGRVVLRLRDGRQLPPLPGAEAVELVAAVVAARSPGLLLPAGPVVGAG
jgi:threonyl-tRNA synthetase